MSKNRAKFITMISLAALCIFFLGLAVQALFPVKKAFADEMTYAPSSVFAAGTGGSVGASEVAEGEDTQPYILFTFGDGGRTYFRRDLALKWFEADESGKGVAKYFSMTFSFGALSFESFKISFESAEENITKEGKTTNSLLFRVKENNLEAAVVNASEQEAAAEELESHYVTVGSVADKSSSDDVTVAFSGEGANAGEFTVSVKYNGTEAHFEGNDLFTNIGGNYMEYRSSTSSTPNTPITFEADLPEAEGDEEPSLTVLMKELNGQKFALTEGRVTDDTDPVLVLNEAVYPYTLGSRFSLTYETIDVLDDTPQTNRYYYMAKPAAEEDEAAGEYKKPTDDDYSLLNTNTFFMPTKDEETITKGYVSIRLRLDDGRGEEHYAYSYLSWYAADPETTVETLNEGTENAFDCVVVLPPDGTQSRGPKYTGITAESSTQTNKTDEALDTAVENYEKELAALEEEGISAGNGAYFYLPSLRDLISCDYTDYRNLRFYISYYTQTATSASSVTSLRYNALRFEIPKRGEYKFKIYAQDASGNTMRLYYKGKLESVSADNVWEIEEIPEFHITVGYSGATIEDQKSQQTGYLDSTYNVSSFDIVALDYAAEYKLYRFDRQNLGDRQMPLYEDFWKNSGEYVETYRDCLVEITAYDSSAEKDDNAYRWDPKASSLSFRPQVAGFYVVEIDLRDAEYPGDVMTKYQVIRVDNPIDEIRTKTNWLSENWLSVVFFSISAVLAVAIVVLFVVKPSDKKVEEVDLAKLKGKNKKK